MRALKRIKVFASLSVVIYLLAAAVIWRVSDYRGSVIERLNAVLDWGDYPAQLDKGAEPYDERRLRMAVRYYKLVAEILPDSDQPEAMIGFCYARLGETALAVQYYRRASTKADGHFWLNYNLAVLYGIQKDSKRAVAALEKVLQMEPRSAVEAAVLAPLTRMLPEQRRMLLLRAVDFTGDIRKSAYQMMVQYKGSGSYSPDVPVVLHPWAAFIQPGKERFF